MQNCELKPEKNRKKVSKKRNLKKETDYWEVTNKWFDKTDQRYIVFLLIIIVFLGCLTINRDSGVYVLQKDLVNIQNDISDLKEENEALKVKILQYSSLSNIEEKAGSTLKMQVPYGDDIDKMDFSDNYFGGIDSSPAVSSENSKSIWQRIKDFFN